MAHPDLQKPARFLYAPFGRGMIFLFMGCCILGHHAGGWVVGIYNIVIGILSVVISFFHKG
ncbi:hypothetical protein AGDE_01087 [Angomonas deanei]|uniref:COPI associated protein, putative n=1 Tax=Angomonas deanei TaxID=59799 RepID=A0A7G2CXA8_9TRYP|nr:hypothetical protein AGDE_01087 [Angomonas deanei]CAD2222922.1 COPI associated protein, putative [Angomonas deanei]|eukprot:EPY42836.1 hypothetical protein AGDE_01087 [Angomonas deanei]